MSMTAVTVSARLRALCEYTFLALITSFYICIAGNVCFLPVAISVRDLREQVVLRLRHQHPSGLEAVGIKIPSGN